MQDVTGTVTAVCEFDGTFQKPEHTTNNFAVLTKTEQTRSIWLQGYFNLQSAIIKHTTSLS